MFKIYNTLENANHAQPRVTALLACQDNLMPASWHMPVSKSPFRYAVAVREENYTHQLLTQKGSFAGMSKGTFYWVLQISSMNVWCVIPTKTVTIRYL